VQILEVNTTVQVYFKSLRSHLICSALNYSM